MTAFSIVSLLAVAWVLGFVFTNVLSWRQNIAKAKRTGLNYVVCLCHPYSTIWYLIQDPILFIAKAVLPKSWQTEWMLIMTKDWGYRFAESGLWDRLGDTFIVATPQSIMVCTRCPDTINQVTSRRDDFTKATAQYAILEMLGHNIVTTDGAVWKMHRKAIGPLFNEASAALAFDEAIRQAQSMLRMWRGDDGGGDVDDAGDRRIITTIPQDTMSLALNVIGTVGFGLRFLWPGEEAPKNADPRMNKYTRLERGSGHTMTFPQATAEILNNLITILLVPTILLENLPFKWAKVAREANDNYVQYMRELVKDKNEDLQRNGVAKSNQSMDIVGALVGAQDAQQKQQQQQQQQQKKTDTAPWPRELQLTDDSIISNAFVMMLAGHETSANMLHYGLILLATRPSSQRAVQADLDRLFPAGAEDPTAWRFEDVINDLLTSMPGAVLNETLRFIPPVAEVPKLVSPARDQVIAVGRGVPLPAGALVSLSVVSAGRNEKCWPTNEAGESDVHEWIPERWFRASSVSTMTGAAARTMRKRDDSRPATAGDDSGGEDDDDDDGVEKTSAGAERPMYRPVRGSFMAFSDGARSCVGRRIARVETVAALAVVFRKYSVELAVDDWADDEAVEKMSSRERAELYEKAKARCRETLLTATTTITLKLPGDTHVPIRVVRRGKERFIGQM